MTLTRPVRVIMIAGVTVMAVVLSVLVGRALLLTSPPTPAGVFTGSDVDPDWVANQLAASIRFRTISGDTESSAAKEFEGLHRHLRQSFPRVFSSLHSRTVGQNALLLRWDGVRAGDKPILLAGHLDVVPIEPGTESDWAHPPFAGTVADGFVWGRGTLDDKVGVVSMLCAVERLLDRGFVPARTVYLAFGDDEEVGGSGGAAAIARDLRSRGISLELVLDEGGIVLKDGLPGLEVPAALVGVAEKGYASLSLTVRSDGGHSSMPPPQSSVGVLAAAVARLEAHPMNADLRAPTDEMFSSLAAAMPFPHRLVLANLWLFEPVVLRGLAGHPSSNALIRTTTAATLFHGGSVDNVLPAQARAVVNFRILPGDTVQDVVDHVTDIIDDSRVTIDVLPDAREPSMVSRSTTAGFEALGETIREVFRGSVVAPYLVVGGTDARHYAQLTDAVYRFLPIRLAAADRPRIHGANERIALDDLVLAVSFYEAFIQDMTP